MRRTSAFVIITVGAICGATIFPGPSPALAHGMSFDFSYHWNDAGRLPSHTIRAYMPAPCYQSLPDYRPPATNHVIVSGYLSYMGVDQGRYGYPVTTRPEEWDRARHGGVVHYVPRQPQYAPPPVYYAQPLPAEGASVYVIPRDPVRHPADRGFGRSVYQSRPCDERSGWRQPDRREARRIRRHSQPGARIFRDGRWEPYNP